MAGTATPRLTLAAHEFIGRFLIHVLRPGFHRIRHYGLFANGARAENLARARQLLQVEDHQDQPEPGEEGDQPPRPAYPCPSRGAPMIIIETIEPGHAPPRPATEQGRQIMTTTPSTSSNDACFCRRPPQGFDTPDLKEAKVLLGELK